MDEILSYITSCFESKSFDGQTKKIVRHLAKNLKQEDINYLITSTFKLFRQQLDPHESVFYIDCLEGVYNALNASRTEQKIVSDVCFSPNDNCVGRLADFVNSAVDNLSICVFTISDDRISRHLLTQHKRGIQIRIITDNEKQFDKGSDIFELAQAGIQIKIDNTDHHMHHKFAIVDNNSLLTGSYNWTMSAAEFNQENFIVLSDAFAIKRYKDEFDRLWKRSVDL